ncbi:DUF2226 domain-containing protein [archaeon]|nr:DUF2226 domain-containing protein [archaeon]
MGIAAGNPVDTGISLKQVDGRESLTSLGRNKFNGYVCIATLGRAGIEEGIIVLEQGATVLASYEYFKYNKKYSGAEALKRLLNALLAPSGVVDVFSLSTQQVRLVKTLKEEDVVQLVPAEKLALPAKYAEEFTDLVIPRSERQAEGLLEKLGLPRSEDVPYTRGSLLRHAKREVG